MPQPELLNDITVQFLISYAPFTRMAAADLHWLAGQLQLVYFPAGAVIVEGRNSAHAPLNIIQRGHVRARGGGGGADGVVLGPGECFPLWSRAADGSVPEPTAFTATEDVFCFRMTPELAERLRERSVPFRNFCGAAPVEDLKDSLAGLRSGFIDRAIGQNALSQPLSGLVRREPVACHAQTPVTQALSSMSAAGVGTIAVVDGEQRPIGIFTLTDLMNRVVLPGAALSEPVAGVMTGEPACLDEGATAQDAMALMATRGLHQLLVTRGDRLAGVISERDLFSLQRASIRGVLQAMRGANDEAGLLATVGEITRLSDNLLAQGVLPEHLTRIVTALNDALLQRLLELRAPRFDLQGIEYCWLALGSEGRREQAIVTDQDNALVFAAEAPAHAARLRERLLPFALAVNEALARFGFPLCAGNIMASNPQCCLSSAEWRERFAQWIREPTPDALLGANIFFDLRPLAGVSALAEDLRTWVLERTSESRLFLGLLVANALQCEPPLGLIRSFRTEEGAHAGTVNLKTHGTRLFVDAARVLALAFGIADTNTVQRLRQGARRLHLPERDVAGLVQAFEFLQLLRIRSPGNRVDPYGLSDPDQRSLKEAYRQARHLQSLLQQFVAR